MGKGKRRNQKKKKDWVSFDLVFKLVFEKQNTKIVQRKCTRIKKLSRMELVD